MLSQSVAGTYLDGELEVHSIDVSGKLYSAIFQISNPSTYEFSLSSAELIGVKTDPNSMYFPGILVMGHLLRKNLRGVLKQPMEALSRAVQAGMILQPTSWL